VNHRPCAHGNHAVEISRALSVPTILLGRIRAYQFCRTFWGRKARPRPVVVWLGRCRSWVLPKPDCLTWTLARGREWARQDVASVRLAIAFLTDHVVVHKPRAARNGPEGVSCTAVVAIRAQRRATVGGCYPSRGSGGERCRCDGGTRRFAVQGRA